MVSTIGIPRLGLVLPKRLARQAVLRNLIRRQVREAFRLRATQLPGLDIVLRLTRSVNGSTGERAGQKLRFRLEIEGLLDRAVSIIVPENTESGKHET